MALDPSLLELWNDPRHQYMSVEERLELIQELAFQHARLRIISRLLETDQDFKPLC